MTTYIGITEAQSNPFAPLTSELVKQLRDNPIAIAEGAPDAPRVEAMAMQGSVAGGNLLFGTGGTGVVYASDSDESDTFFPDATFKATTSCEVRVSAEYARSGSGAASLRIWKNGTAVLTETKTPTSYSTHSVDISLEAGDIVRVSGAGDTSGGSSCTVRNIRYLVGSQRTVGGI